MLLRIDITNGDFLLNFKYCLYIKNSIIIVNISNITIAIIYIKTLFNKLKQLAIYTTIGFVIQFAIMIILILYLFSFYHIRYFLKMHLIKKLTYFY